MANPTPSVDADHIEAAILYSRNCYAGTSFMPIMLQFRHSAYNFRNLEMKNSWNQIKYTTPMFEAVNKHNNLLYIFLFTQYFWKQ
jgi:hypothetical protein